MKFHIQTKHLSSRDWKTVASFADQVGASDCYLHVYRDYHDDVRLIVESIDGRGVTKVLLGTGA